MRGLVAGLRRDAEISKFTEEEEEEVVVKYQRRISYGFSLILGTIPELSGQELLSENKYWYSFVTAFLGIYAATTWTTLIFLLKDL